MAKEIIIYGSIQCPDTVQAKELFDKEGIKYEFVDILDSMDSLKEFINVRDANPALFADTVANRGIGVPVIVIDDFHVYKGLDNLDFARLK